MLCYYFSFYISDVLPWNREQITPAFLEICAIEMKLAKGWKMTLLAILSLFCFVCFCFCFVFVLFCFVFVLFCFVLCWFFFCFVFFLHTEICLTSPSYSLHWFSTVFLQNSCIFCFFFHWFSTVFLQNSCIFCFFFFLIVLYWLGNFKGRFLKITLPEKPLEVSYTNGHISKSRKSKLDSGYSGTKLKLKNVLFTVIPRTHFLQNVTCSLFCGSASHMHCVNYRSMNVFLS